MNVADELQKLQQLHQSGAISDEEYAKAKANLLNSPPQGGSGVPANPATIGTANQAMGHVAALVSVGRPSLYPWQG